MTPASITLLDSAHGTRLIARGLDIRSDDPALWVNTHPEEIRNLHRADLSAGAESITTCTFGANRHWLGRYHSCDTAGINRRAVEIARDCIREFDSKASIAGCVGPVAIESEPAFREQVDALADAGVSRVVVETLAYDQIPRLCQHLPANPGIPVYVTLWNWGPQPAETARRLADHGVAGWGINCMSDPAPIFDVFAVLREAGLAARILKSSIPEIDSFVRVSRQAIEFGVDSIGGCCGTDERHITALDFALASHSQRIARRVGSSEGFQAQ